MFVRVLRWGRVGHDGASDDARADAGRSSECVPRGYVLHSDYLSLSSARLA